MDRSLLEAPRSAREVVPSVQQNGMRPGCRSTARSMIQALSKYHPFVLHKRLEIWKKHNGQVDKFIKDLKEHEVVVTKEGLEKLKKLTQELKNEKNSEEKRRKLLDWDGYFGASLSALLPEAEAFGEKKPFSSDKEQMENSQFKPRRRIRRSSAPTGWPHSMRSIGAAANLRRRPSARELRRCITRKKNSAERHGT